MDEDFFQILLDENPGESPRVATATRLLFANWLAERGDSRAAGYRYMAVNYKAPQMSDGSEAFLAKFRREISWDWTTHVPLWLPHRIPTVLLDCMQQNKLLPHNAMPLNTAVRLEYLDRRTAEVALCQAIQEGILNG